jgi:hypothetical protein
MEVRDMVFKYIIGNEPTIKSLVVPAPAIFLSCAVQKNQVVAYFQCSPNANDFERRIVLTETGKYIPDGQKEYCGALMLFEGNYVLHAWRLLF